MAESEKKRSAWNLYFGVAVLLLAGAVFLKHVLSDGRDNLPASVDTQQVYSFDPGPWPELQIKGQAPDGASSWSLQPATLEPLLSEALLNKGGELFAKACAGCHGPQGKGDGPLSIKVEMPSLPADLSSPLQSIKIRSTVQGMLPVDRDLFRTLTRGLPGTAMLSFHALTEDARWALVMHVKSLWRQKPRDMPELVGIPPKPPDDAELRALGAAEFKKTCQNCHGPEALGGTSAEYNRETGKPYPGIRFARAGGNAMLTGNSDEDIARTLLTGFGTRSPMMSFKPYFYGDEPTDKDKLSGDRRLWGTVYYVRTLFKTQARQ